jgi:hypothetical protein
MEAFGESPPTVVFSVKGRFFLKFAAVLLDVGKLFLIPQPYLTDTTDKVGIIIVPCKSKSARGFQVGLAYQHGSFITLESGAAVGSSSKVVLGELGMRFFLHCALMGILALAILNLASAQSPSKPNGPGPFPGSRAVEQVQGPLPGEFERGLDEKLERVQRGLQELRRKPSLGEKTEQEDTIKVIDGSAEYPQKSTEQTSEQELATLRQQLQAVREQHSIRQVAAQQDDKLKKQVELQGKQIEALEKLLRLVRDELRKRPPAGTVVEKLQTQAATLEARSLQAARRDQELAHAIDDTVEKQDAEQRNGFALPAPLKELFLPSQTNESPLSIYGVLTAGYTKFQGQAGDFQINEFSPFFLLQLNERFLLEAELVFSQAGVELSQAQLDFIANDWLTVVVGHFLVPIGFFNERLHPTWINKLPDFPLMFRQVSPADFKTNGIQLRGAHYVGCTPLKLEYAVFVGNGAQLNQQQPTLSQVANLEGLDTSLELRHNLAVGGRLGFWLPDCGVMAGVSGLSNGPYTPVAGDSFDLWGVDFGYHQGDWDVRFEYAQMFQEAVSFIGNNINRRGLYAQVAYRPYEAPHRYLQNFEGVFRYGYTNFSGIDPTALDLTTFNTQVDVPVNRHQYTLGLNYYFYPSLVLKLAYQMNREVKDFKLHDDVFLAQVAWGF